MYIQNRFTDIENKLVVTEGERDRRRDNLRVWDEDIQTAIYKIDKKQGFTI